MVTHAYKIIIHEDQGVREVTGGRLSETMATNSAQWPLFTGHADVTATIPLAALMHHVAADLLFDHEQRSGVLEGRR